MASSSRQSAAVAGEMSSDEQAQLDQMRVDDAASPELVEQQEQQGERVAPQDVSAEGDGTAAPPDKRPQMVPHAALHEERERRKEAETAAKEDRRLRQVLEERTNLILQRFQQPQPVAQPQPEALPPIPPLSEDPAAHIVGLVQRQNLDVQRQGEVLQQVVQALLQQNQQNQQAQAIGNVQSRAMALERDYAAQNPDYMQAVAFLAEHRHQELVEAGVNDPAQRQAIISQEALGIAHRALSEGGNPAAVVHRLAKHRGFQAPKPAAAAEATQQDNAARLDGVARGQQQSAQSLGNVRGASPRPMNAQRLLEMSDSEFTKAMESPEGRELLGA